MQDSVTDSLHRVSILVPCRNEETFIGKCLDSIIANDYPKDRLEVLVVDGNSEDATKKIVREYVQEYQYIKLLDNPRRTTPCGLNLGIKNATGESILWMSAHNEYERGYISNCVRYLDEFSADAVGGVIRPVPRNSGFIGKSICIALSHPFGVGNSIHRTGARSPVWVDTAFGVCYKKEVFQKVGFFNEHLARGQDMEFSLRLRKAGLKTLLAPEITSCYYARSEMKSFIKHNIVNGLWAILPFKYTNITPVSWRHLVPLMFVLSLAATVVLSLFLTTLSWLSLLIAGCYALANLYFSCTIAIRERNLKYLFVMPIIFIILHVGYGLGSIWGLLRVGTSRRFWINLRAILLNAVVGWSPGSK